MTESLEDFSKDELVAALKRLLAQPQGNPAALTHNDAHKQQPFGTQPGDKHFSALRPPKDGSPFVTILHRGRHNPLDGLVFERLDNPDEKMLCDDSIVAGPYYYPADWHCPWLNNLVANPRFGIQLLPPGVVPDLSWDIEFIEGLSRTVQFSLNIEQLQGIAAMPGLPRNLAEQITQKIEKLEKQKPH